MKSTQSSKTTKPGSLRQSILFEKQPFQDKELERIRQILFWQFQYVRRRALQDYEEFWEQICSEIEAWEDPHLKSATIRYVANAILTKISCGDCSYDLTQVPKSTLENYIHFVKISMEYGYYLNDIIIPYSSIDLIKFIHEYNTTPLPPLPFFGTLRNRGEQTAMHKISMHLYNAIYYPVSNKDESNLNKIATGNFQKNIETELKVSYHDSSKIDTNTAEIFYEDWNKFLDGNVENRFWEIKPYIKIFKKFTKAKYRTESMEGRAVGLFLWDCKYGHKIEGTKAMKELNALSERLTARSDQEYSEFLNGADQCIKNGTVLAASAKSGGYYRKK